ncbi:MAG: hypothetical protein ACR2JV_05975 [Gaiellales bacterium]
MSGDLHPSAPATPLTALLEVWLAGDVTALEAGRRIDRQRRELEDLDSDAARALVRLFPPYPADAPDPAVVYLLLQALRFDEVTGDALAAIAGRRALLEAVVTLEPDAPVLDAILRPGERVMLGTKGGRSALVAILNDDPEPFAAWLSRTVIDPDAFSATTGDVPILDLDNLRRLLVQLADATESLAPGAARVMVADEWVAETTVAALSDDVTFAEVARVIGEELLGRDAPILLWHAAHELALVAEDDPDLRDAVLRRCLPRSEAEGGRCPSEAAAPLLRELGTRGAIRFLADARGELDGDAWRAIGTAYLRREIAAQWVDWRDEVERWAAEDDAGRALAALDALLRSPAPEAGAVEWFTESPVPSVRAACRQRLGLSA